MKNYKDFLYQAIGDKIKSRREDLQMSQKVLSENLNIGRASISNIEVGRHQITLYTLYEISQILGVDVNEFLPTYEELIKIVKSNLETYSDILEARDLDLNQIESVKDSIKNIK